MGAVRGASICAFTASISIAENGNNSLLFIKMSTREKYLYRYRWEKKGGEKKMSAFCGALLSCFWQKEGSAGSERRNGQYSF